MTLANWCIAAACILPMAVALTPKVASVKSKDRYDNAAPREVAAAEIPWCHAHRTGVIAYSPMQSGILTETFSKARLKDLPKEDWRTRSPRFQSPHIEKSLGIISLDMPMPSSRTDTTTSSPSR